VEKSKGQEERDPGGKKNYIKGKQVVQGLQLVWGTKSCLKFVAAPPEPAKCRGRKDGRGIEGENAYRKRRTGKKKGIYR